MITLEQQLKKQVYFCWLAATAEVCQSHSLELLKQLSVKSEQQRDKLHQSMFELVVNASVIIQYAIITGKIRPEQSLNEIKAYCHHTIWPEQSEGDYYHYLDKIIQLAWFFLQECFEQIAQVANAKLTSFLESEAFTKEIKAPPAEGYLEDGTPVWSMATLAKYSGRSITEVQEELTELIENGDNRITIVSHQKVHTIH